jgi:uncharacterized membrane protein YbhN (UPF0104 family)
MLSAPFGFAVAFWLYGIGRTIHETVGINAAATFSGLAFGVCLPSVILVLVLVVRRSFRKRRWAVALLILCLLLGSLLSELSILHDEQSFRVEAGAVNSVYSRARAWPNDGCTLVFVPGKGVHATD